MRIFDTHIHLFKKPYCDIFKNSYIKNEVSLYEEYRQVFNIAGAFVICYEDKKQIKNNCFVESLQKKKNWIYSFGYVKSDINTMEQKAQELIRKKHFGISCYLDNKDDAMWLVSEKLFGFWEFLQKNLIPISFNLSAFQCKPLKRVLEKFPNTVVLISHMARPKVKNGKLSDPEYKYLLSLASFKNVYVKLSGFYAFVKDGWRYPQTELFCVIDKLKKIFGTKRLLFASDFSPVLEFNTFRQTMELLKTEYKGFNQKELEDIYFNNAQGIVIKRLDMSTQNARPTVGELYSRPAVCKCGAV
jgi:L-fuconolactonase